MEITEATISTQTLLPQEVLRNLKCNVRGNIVPLLEKKYPEQFNFDLHIDEVAHTLEDENCKTLTVFQAQCGELTFYWVTISTTNKAGVAITSSDSLPNYIKKLYQPTGMDINKTPINICPSEDGCSVDIYLGDYENIYKLFPNMENSYIDIREESSNGLIEDPIY